MYIQESMVVIRNNKQPISLIVTLYYQTAPIQKISIANPCYINCLMPYTKSKLTGTHNKAI